MIVDTDTLIRYLTYDDEDKAEKVVFFFEHNKNLELTDVTFAETYWTLHSYYSFSKEHIIEKFRELFRLNYFRCNQSILQKTCDILEKHNTSFIDAYIAAYAQTKNDGKVVSFDKGYDKVKGVTRIEP